MNIVNEDYFAAFEAPTVTLTGTTNGPALWAELLQQLPGGIVAGGVVRDWFLGVQPKDIDVFFPRPLLDNFVFPSPFCSLTGEKWDHNSERGEEYAALPDVELVQRGYVNGIQIDLVFLGITIEHPGQLLDRFDFGVTRSAFTIEHGVIDTPEAMLDRQNRTVTLLLDDRPERAQARFDRFNERMGTTWRFVK